MRIPSSVVRALPNAPLLSRWLCLVAVFEGASYLLLLFVAMPLKYLADWPHAVSVVGAAHGGLFVLYVLLAGVYWIAARRSFGWLVWAMAASVIPGATFVLERQLRREARSVAVEHPRRAEPV